MISNGVRWMKKYSICRLYLDIEKVRFGYRLQTEIIYSDEVLSLKLPSLLLQPVVENAIKFGLYDTTGEVLIKLEATKENNYLKITVRIHLIRKPLNH